MSFSHPEITAPQDGHWDEAASAVDRMSQGHEPDNRLEAGLAFAIIAGRDAGGVPEIEDRRFEQAYARVLARDWGEASPPGLSSVDWARMLSVDASIQREAEQTLKVDALDKADRHRWGSMITRNEPWSQAGVPPSVFTKATEDELKSMASGAFHELAGDRAAQVEVSLLSAAAPQGLGLETRLLQTAQALPVGTGPQALQEGVRVTDLAWFGPMDRDAVPGSEIASVADRMHLAKRAEEVGHRDARGLFDPTPGRNPFAVEPRHRQAGSDAASGRRTDLFGRVVETAAGTYASLEMEPDPQSGARLASAAARLAKAGANPSGDVLTDVRALVADMLIQRVASDAISRVDSGAKGLLEHMVSGSKEARESVGFTRLPSEIQETKAVAQGRFEDIGDARGIASGVRNTMWRASLSGSEGMNRAIDMHMPVVRIRAGTKGPVRHESIPAMPSKRSASR